MAEISKTMLNAVLGKLSEIEAEFRVRVLYACESGSRAWGFASTDSDYDVRFIYVHPREWYLSIDLEDKRDVIETSLDGVLDISGWELRKALKLFQKSNPPLLEWLGSPIVYRKTVHLLLISGIYRRNSFISPRVVITICAWRKRIFEGT